MPVKYLSKRKKPNPAPPSTSRREREEGGSGKDFVEGGSILELEICKLCDIANETNLGNPSNLGLAAYVCRVGTFREEVYIFSNDIAILTQMVAETWTGVGRILENR